jgi:hypothetical protein
MGRPKILRAFDIVRSEHSALLLLLLRMLLKTNGRGELGGGERECAERSDLASPCRNNLCQQQRQQSPFGLTVGTLSIQDKSVVARSVISNVCVLAGGPPLRFVGVAVWQEARAKEHQASNRNVLYGMGRHYLLAMYPSLRHAVAEGGKRIKHMRKQHGAPRR